MELPFGFLHFAEHDSPLESFMFSCIVMFSSFILSGSSASVVNFHVV